MSVERILVNLRECRRRVTEWRGRADSPPLDAAILRCEAGPVEQLVREPFTPICGVRPHYPRGPVISHGDSPYALAFFCDTARTGSVRPWPPSSPSWPRSSTNSGR